MEWTCTSVVDFSEIYFGLKLFVYCSKLSYVSHGLQNVRSILNRVTFVAKCLAEITVCQAMDSLWKYVLSRQKWLYVISNVPASKHGTFAYVCFRSIINKKHCLLKNGWAIDRVMAKSYALVYLPSERCKLAEVLFSSDCVSVCVCMQCTDQSDSLGVKC